METGAAQHTQFEFNERNAYNKLQNYEINVKMRTYIVYLE